MNAKGGKRAHVADGGQWLELASEIEDVHHESFKGGALK
jgi:hypothetical protein